MPIFLPARHICVTRRGQESFIAQELSPLSKTAHCTELAPGVVELTGVDIPFLSKNPIFFSRQILPNVFELGGTSIKTIATAAVEVLMRELDTDDTTPWCLHVYEPSCVETGEEYNRTKLIATEIQTLLKQKRRSLLRRLTTDTTKDSSLVQILLATPSINFMSVSTAEVQESLRSNLTPFRAGYVEVPDDKAPPSRAFKKLIEAIEVFHLSPKRGETCVDLGASPGGWTHVMATRGAKTTAIDRSPLSPELMRNKNVTFRKGDAHAWLPSKSVSWLVCDVITSPDKTLAILKAWLSRPLCAHFCVTVKFKGAPDFQSLEQLRELLVKHTTWFDGKQLTNNKNELTVVGETKSNV